MDQHSPLEHLPIIGRFVRFYEAWLGNLLRDTCLFATQIHPVIKVMFDLSKIYVVYYLFNADDLTKYNQLFLQKE